MEYKNFSCPIFLCLHQTGPLYTTDIKVFADDTSLFSIVNYAIASASALSKDLIKMKDWEYQQNISFNSDWAKQWQENIFSRKTKKSTYLPHYCNNVNVKLTHAEQHLGFQLDSKISFNKDTINNISKKNKRQRASSQVVAYISTQELIHHS